MKILNIRDLNKLKDKGESSLSPKGAKLSISISTCGLALGADETFEAMTKEKEKQGLRISLGQTGCMGFCNLEPLGILKLPGKPTLIYARMTLDKSRQLIRDVKKKKISHEDVLCKIQGGTNSNRPDKEFDDVPEYHEAPIFKNQLRIALKNCGLIDPLSVPEYVVTGGYFPLYKALYEMSPEDILEEINKSGLRGRGGAWFSTGSKWTMARKVSEEEKFVVCNADEGDPGAYKDRTIMEGNPFRLFEGMTLAGYAIGGHQGLIYLREEYPHTYEFLGKAIEIAKRHGLLGKGILGSDFNFTIKIIRGGGAYICGEETALLDSLEGEVGDPRLRPPFPVEKGLWDRPTIVNNVETLSNVPLIIENGGEWYAGIGTKESKGTKIMSVVGKVKQPGLYEVPLGTRLDQVIYHMAGGPPDGRTIKAVQVGSPFGNFIPGDKLNITLDPETLRNMGSMIGSGVIVVLDQDSCLVDILGHILTFFVEESCGKCVPCREGVFMMREIMTKIYKGNAALKDLYTLTELGETARDFALCGLGGGAPAPILNGMRDFKKDFKAHITTGKCPWPGS